MNLYNQNTIEVLQQFRTTKEGIGHDEAKKRLQDFGPNELQEKKKYLHGFYSCISLKTS